MVKAWAMCLQTKKARTWVATKLYVLLDYVSMRERFDEGKEYVDLR